MNKKEQAKIVSKVLSHGKECTVGIDVWRPSAQDIKSILAVDYQNIHSNNETSDCTIFTINCKKLKGSLESHGVSITLFCDEPEAKFMRKYIKEKGGE